MTRKGGEVHRLELGLEDEFFHKATFCSDYLSGRRKWKTNIEVKWLICDTEFWYNSHPCSDNCLIRIKAGETS
jgi:hypothetical protein